MPFFSRLLWLTNVSRIIYRKVVLLLRMIKIHFFQALQKLEWMKPCLKLIPGNQVNCWRGNESQSWVGKIFTFWSKFDFPMVRYSISLQTLGYSFKTFFLSRRRPLTPYPVCSTKFIILILVFKSKYVASDGLQEKGRYSFDTKGFL